MAVPANDIVNIKTTYDIIFTTGSTGTIGKIVINFGPGTGAISPELIERSNIGSGSLTNIATVLGSTMTYTVDNPVSVVAGTTIRLEIGQIFNSDITSISSVTVTTKTSSDTIIDGPTDSLGFQLKQIAGPEIESNSITTEKIASSTITDSDIKPQTVTGNKIAP